MATPLVLIPGLGSNGIVWQRTIAMLGDAAACTIGDTLQDDSLLAMAARILAAAPPTFALAGVSMGAMVGIEIATLAPDRVTHLALFDTNPRADTPEQVERRLATNAAVAATGDFAALAALGLGSLIRPDSPPDIVADMIAMSVAVGPETYIRQNLAAAGRRDLRPLLPAIAMPTLVAVGADDVLTPPRLVEEVAAGIPGAAFHVIPDCGHLPPIERADATAALLRTLIG